MSDQSINKPPTWFWVVAVFAVFWNLFGVMVYIMQVTASPESLALLPEAERALMENTPAWATGAFAIAVFGGFIASILLLMRKRVATFMFILSTTGVIVQMYHWLFMTNSIEVYGASGVAMPVTVIILGVFFIWFSDMSTKKEWIN